MYKGLFKGLILTLFSISSYLLIAEENTNVVVNTPHNQIAINAFHQNQHYDLGGDSIVTIIDFSLPSNEKRFFVYNIKSNTVIHSDFVSHGRNSPICRAIAEAVPT